MKKYIFFALLCVSVLGNAQIKYGTGIKAGIVTASPQYYEIVNNEDNEGERGERYMGWYIGMSNRVFPISSRAILMSDMTISQRSLKVNNEFYNYTHTYIFGQIASNIKIQVIDRLSVSGGGYLNLKLLDIKEEGNSVYERKANFDGYTRTDRMKRRIASPNGINMGLVFGAGYEVIDHLFIEAQYELGSKIFAPDYKENSLFLGIGYYW